MINGTAAKETILDGNTDRQPNKKRKLLKKNIPWCYKCCFVSQIKQMLERNREYNVKKKGIFS